MICGVVNAGGGVAEGEGDGVAEGDGEGASISTNSGVADGEGTGDDGAGEGTDVLRFAAFPPPQPLAAMLPVIRLIASTK